MVFSHGSITPGSLLPPNGFPSNNRTKSTIAKKPDVATVMVPEIEDPLERFRKHFTQGTLTRPLVISCLEDAVRLNQPGSRMGEAAITWIWNSYDSIEYPLDTDLVNSIAILLDREGKEELLWDWMDQETQKPRTKKAPSIPGVFEPIDQNYMWRATALRALVEAKARLATDRSLDAALEAFLRGTNVPYYLYTPAAANFCHRMLSMAPRVLGPARSYEDMRSGLVFNNTSPRLWDAFYTEIGKRPSWFAKHNQALMRLHHPQQPDPWPLFKLWLQAENKEGHSLRRITSRTAAIAQVETSRDMQLVLKHLGHHEEAQQLKVLTLKLFPLHMTLQGQSRRERLSVEGKPLPSFQSPRDPEEEDFSESPW